jgi:hypothetical protein
MSTEPDIVRSFTYQQLKEYTGQRFEVRFEDGSLDLTLETVSLLMEKHVSPQMHRDAFSLHFRGPRELMLKQGTYAIWHETLGGPLPIFIVPLAPDSRGYIYEAIFN